MYYYKLRLNIISGLQIQYSKLESYFVRFIRAQEVGKISKKPHYHYYVETELKQGALRQNIRNWFGSHVHSLNTLDVPLPIEYIAYILKEDPDPMYYPKGSFDPGRLQQARDYDLSIKKDLKRKRVQVVEDYILTKEKYEKRFPTPYEIVDEIIEFYLMENLSVRKHQIQSMATTILVKNIPAYRKAFIDSIVEDLPQPMLQVNYPGNPITRDCGLNTELPSPSRNRIKIEKRLFH